MIMDIDNENKPKIASLRALIDKLETQKSVSSHGNKQKHHIKKVLSNDIDSAAMDDSKDYDNVAVCEKFDFKSSARKVRSFTEDSLAANEAVELSSEASFGLDDVEERNTTSKNKRSSQRRKSFRAKETQQEERFTTINQVYDYALNLLTFRDYSKAEMLNKLVKKGASEELAKAVLDKLLEYNFLNEERYAFRVYEMWLNKRIYGRLHLQAELKKRCIESECITKVMNAFSLELEEERAENAAVLFVKQNCKRLQELESFNYEDDAETVTSNVEDCINLRCKKNNSKKLSRWACARSGRAAAKLAALQKLKAAAGRFMVSRGFSGRYMHILLSKLHCNNDI